MNNKNGKSLEETIKELGKRYKNVPSPLSENYNRMGRNVNFIPTQTQTDERIKLLGDFKPRSYRFGEPL